jgi:acyl carrier protein
MDINDIKARITPIIVSKLGVEASQVTPEASFTKDLGADSLDTVEVMLAIEQEFDISIDESDQDKVQSVGDLIDYLSKKLS